METTVSLIVTGILLASLPPVISKKSKGQAQLQELAQIHQAEHSQLTQMTLIA